MEGQVTDWAGGPQPNTSLGHCGKQCLLGYAIAFL